MLSDEKQLLSSIPDRPEWIETRWILLTGQGRCHPFSLPGATLVEHRQTGLASLVGCPSVTELRELLESSASIKELLIQEGSPLYAVPLPDWEDEVAVVHRQRRSEPEKRSAQMAVRFFDPTREQLPADLSVDVVDEIQSGLVGPIAVSMAGARPSAFCYAGAQSETLWDAGVETLPDFRRQGRARACAQFMIEFMKRRNKSPVWAAVESNTASLQLASSLGFEAVSKLRYLHR